MKNRLKSGPLTDEDRAAWFDWQVNRKRDWSLWGALERRSAESDQRDADLMLELVELRSIGAYADVRHLQTVAGQDGYAAGGWMGRYRWHSPKWSDGRDRT